MEEFGCLGVIILFIIDFLLTAFGLWLILFVLSCFGVTITFTWGLAFGFWIIMKILKLL